ncbi:Stealth CR1 domain-containing protein, partial [Glycomyces terrestris]
MPGQQPSLGAAARHLAGRLLPAGLRARLQDRRRRRIGARRVAELVAADPGLRAFVHDGFALAGRLADSFTAAEAAEANLRIVAEAAEAAGIPYFVVPGKSHVRYAVGVRHADKKAFLEAMRARYGGTEVYAAKTGGANRAAALYAEGALPKAVKFAQVIRFGRCTLGPHGQLLAGLDYGCDVEFWRDGDQFAADPAFEAKNARLKVQVPAAMLAGGLVAPRPNRVADVLPAEELVPASVEVGDHKHPTYRAFTHRLVDEVDFPVDAVYMWVDGDDPEWAAARAAHLGGDAAGHTHLTGASRYLSRDELKYSLRSLHTFAPFIR